jgi:YegS/Rv2252/BmrU family lipid kinase
VRDWLQSKGAGIETSFEEKLRAQIEKLPAGLRPKLGRDERVVVLDNPHASGGRYAQHGARAGQIYRTLGYDCQVWETERPGHATELAQRAAAEGATFVIACGGDGIVREAVIGLMRVDDRRRPKFSVVPKGTVNVFARTLALQVGPIPDFFHACLKQIFWARIRRVDLGRIDGDPFVCFAGFGFDAAVIENVPANEKKTFREWAYVSAAFKTLFGWGAADPRSAAYEPIAMRVQAPAAGGGVHDVTGYVVAIGNVQFYGPGWFPFHPRARVDDGLLDVVLVTTPDKREMVRIAGQVVRRQHLANPKVAYFQTAGPIDITCAEPVPMHADCELLGRGTTTRIEALPAALEVVH